MKEIIKKFMVYKYDELTEDQKLKVLEKQADINVDHEWWKYIYGEAKDLGFKIEGFDLDRNNYCKIKMIDSGCEIAEEIIKNHGESCETYKHAKQFLDYWKTLVEKYSDGINKDQVHENNEYEFDQDADELEEEFKKTLQEDYRIMLQQEYDYLTSREAIEEIIKANDYDFTEDGDIY